MLPCTVRCSQHSAGLLPGVLFFRSVQTIRQLSSGSTGLCLALLILAVSGHSIHGLRTAHCHSTGIAQQLYGGSTWLYRPNNSSSADPWNWRVSVVATNSTRSKTIYYIYIYTHTCKYFYIYICIIMHLRMGSYVYNIYIYIIFAICEWNTYDIWYIENIRSHAPTASASSCWAESSSPGKKKTDPIWFFASFSCCSEGKLISSVRGGSAMETRLEARQEDYLQLRCQKPATKLCSNTDKTYACSLKWLCRYAFFKSIIEKDSVRLVKFILQIEQLPELVCLAKALCSSPLHFLSFFGRWCKQEVSENLSGLVKSCKHAIQNSSEFIRTAFLAGYQVYQNESLGCQVPCLATAWWGCLLAVTGWRPQLSKSSELVLHQE